MSLAIRIRLRGPDQTMRLGAILALSLPERTGHIFLEGPLGAGKTTLVRGLAASLHGHEQAEISSPSFNLVNLYPTRPPIAHVDLYRLDKIIGLDESILELLEKTRYLVLLEWPDRLPERLRPASYLLLRWLMAPHEDRTGREVEILPIGPWAGEMLERLRPRLEAEFGPR